MTAALRGKLLIPDQIMDSDILSNRGDQGSEGFLRNEPVGSYFNFT
jgi:hypothetical protein